jgi:vacuolar protein sorting-associated protein 13A/C
MLLNLFATVIRLGALKLHIYDELCTEFNISEHGIARFALNDNSLRMKMLSDNSYEAQVVVKSFTMSNTRKGNSKFREIIPAAQHDRNQVMVLYTVSGGPEPSVLAIITVDSPQIILAFDPLFAILKYLTSPFLSVDISPGSTEFEQPIKANKSLEPQPGSAEKKSTLSFRFDLHDAAVNILENESIADSQAIRLTVRELQVSQQVPSVTSELLSAKSS